MACYAHEDSLCMAFLLYSAGRGFTLLTFYLDVVGIQTFTPIFPPMSISLEVAATAIVSSAPFESN